jgi:hypothetical protein
MRNCGRRDVSKAKDRVWGALIALVVQVIILVAGLSVCLGPESSTVEGVPVVASAQGVPEPLH